MQVPAISVLDGDVSQLVVAPPLCLEGDADAVPPHGIQDVGTDSMIMPAGNYPTIPF